MKTFQKELEAVNVSGDEVDLPSQTGGVRNQMRGMSYDEQVNMLSTGTGSKEPGEPDPGSSMTGLMGLIASGKMPMPKPESRKDKRQRKRAERKARRNGEPEPNAHTALQHTFEPTKITPMERVQLKGIPTTPEGERVQERLEFDSTLLTQADMDEMLALIPSIPDPSNREYFTATFKRRCYDDVKALMATHPDGQMPAEVIADVRALIGQLPPENQGDFFLQLQAKSKYANQRDNTSRGTDVGTDASQENMCNLTSLAMMLEYLGHSNPKPDDYPQFEDYLEARRREKGYGDRREVKTMSKLAGDFGVAGFVEIVSWRGVDRQEWWRIRDNHLAAGQSVLLLIGGENGGHYIRLQGVNSDGLIVDDPYGKVKLRKGDSRTWRDYNSKGGQPERNVGEDNYWPWSEVESHMFRGVFTLG